MALKNYFYNVDIYRQSIAEDDFGNMTDDGGVWELNQTILGMIQPKSGSKVDVNNDQTIISDYLMYAELGIILLSTDRIYYDDEFYEIVNIKKGTGVPKRQSHMEFDLKRLGIENNE